jgi:hypothetical protein
MEKNLLHPRRLIIRTRLVLFTMIPALLPLGAIAFFQWLPDPLVRFFFATKGFVAWTLTEYCLQRWAFAKKNQMSIGQETSRIDKAPLHTPIRLFSAKNMAAISGWLGAGVLVIFGPVMLAYFAGWCGGLAYSILIHQFLHHPMAAMVVPRLVKHHIVHHARCADQNFGISSTLWDRIFKTKAESQKLPAESAICAYYNNAQLHKNTLRVITGQENIRKSLKWLFETWALALPRRTRAKGAELYK